MNINDDPFLKDYLVGADQYQKGRMIGQGGYGCVYLVTNTFTNEQYAMKQMSLHNEKEIKVFLREARLLTQLDHPAILKINALFIGKDPNTSTPSCNLILDYMQNGTLEHAIQQAAKGDPIPNWSQIVIFKIIYGIASAMMYVHDRRIIHRDLKPENIFLDEQLQPRIADLGCSRFKSDSDDYMMTKGVGSPIYMAPEVSNGEYGFSADVYSFGIILLRIFNANIVFDVENGQKIPSTYFEILMHIQKGKRYKIPENVPRNWKKLIESCWDTNPENRPTFACIVKNLKEGKLDMKNKASISQIKSYVDSLNVECQGSVRDDIDNMEDIEIDPSMINNIITAPPSGLDFDFNDDDIDDEDAEAFHF